MKRINQTLFVALVLLLTTVGTAAQPISIPLSPQETNLLSAYPALAGARAASSPAIVLAGVHTYSCANGGMIVNLAAFIPDGSAGYDFYVSVSTATHIHSNAVYSWVAGTGYYTWALNSNQSNAPITANYPLPAGTPVIVKMLFAEPNGKPLWYAEMTIADCDGSPASITSNISKAVRIINKNPTFTPDSADPAKATKWNASGKVTYSCSGACKYTLKGKAGKVAAIEQTAKIKPALDTGTRFGVIVVADMSALISGEVVLVLLPSDASLLNIFYYNDGENFVNDEMAIMPIGFGTAPGVNKIDVELRLLDSGTRTPAAGKMKVKAIYVFAV